MKPSRELVLVFLLLSLTPSSYSAPRSSTRNDTTTLQETPLTTVTVVTQEVTTAPEEIYSKDETSSLTNFNLDSGNLSTDSGNTGTSESRATTLETTESTTESLSSKWFHFTESPDSRATKNTDKENGTPPTERTVEEKTTSGISGAVAEVAYRYPIFVPGMLRNTITRLHLEAAPAASEPANVTETNLDAKDANVTVRSTITITESTTLSKETHSVDTFPASETTSRNHDQTTGEATTESSFLSENTTPETSDGNQEVSSLSSNAYPTESVIVPIVNATTISDSLEKETDTMADITCDTTWYETLLGHSTAEKNTLSSVETTIPVLTTTTTATTLITHKEEMDNFSTNDIVTETFPDSSPTELFNNTIELLTTSSGKEMTHNSSNTTTNEDLEMKFSKGTFFESSSKANMSLKVEAITITLPNDTEETLTTTTAASLSSAEIKNVDDTSEEDIKESTDVTVNGDGVTDVSVTTSSSTLKPETETSTEKLIVNSTETVMDTTKPQMSSPSWMLEDDKRYISGTNKDLVAAVQFLHYHDKESSDQCYKLVTAHWNYATNITEETKNKQLDQTMEYSMFYKEAWKNATSFAWKSFNDTVLRRWFKSLSVLGTAALSEEKLNEFNRLKAEMKAVYSTAKVCARESDFLTEEKSSSDLESCTLSLEPDLQRIMTRSRDYDELTYVWKAWRNSAGKPIRQKFLRFVELGNEAAELNGFHDTGDMWRESYESKTFISDLNDLWEQLRPLYEHLHAYVRRRLIQQYGGNRIKADGPIPAHLFGNMWAQSWVSLMDIAQPFEGKPSVDVTSTMESKNMTALEMFRISEEFFTSLGLKAMPEEFWKHSLIEKPKDREILCHASAWDFCNGKDYRIKQCTDITMEDLITVHHEMGHIQYFLQYARQPNVFREGANPGFHEAIGDVLALSVSTPKHLQSIGLLDSVAEDPEGDLNFLMRAALEKVSFLPSGYLIDLWRWGLFNGDIAPEEMNTMWWELRLKYQGICPPVKRTEQDFDPGAKYHVPGNVPYIRYFVSFVIQFQFHKVLCDASGHTGPLFKCDIYRSKEAGQILSQVMELGSSEHWSEAMKIMTGGATNKMDVQPILEYFQPLLVFLKEQNKNETLGWNSIDPTICP